MIVNVVEQIAPGRNSNRGFRYLVDINTLALKKWTRVWFVLLASCFGACGPALAEQVQVAVASNFSAPMKVLQQQFEDSTGHHLRLAFGSSGKFFAQIQHGAPFQVFLSADQAKPEALIKAGYGVAGSRFTYAIGTLVLWSPQAGTVPFDASALRQREGVKQQGGQRIALANPKLAPYGLAARQALQQLQLADTTRARWVMGENIAQTYQFVSSGNAQLGFVALSQIQQPGAEPAGRYWIVPAALHDPIRQDLVLLRNGQNSEGARALVKFMQGEPARRVIAAFGYRLEDAQ